MKPRLASAVLVSALLRHAQSQGGFGTVIARGDATAGSIAVILLEKGGQARLFERLLRIDGEYEWRESAKRADDDAAIGKLIENRRRIDPDLWVIELDIASSERFAAEMNSFG